MDIVQSESYAVKNLISLSLSLSLCIHVYLALFIIYMPCAQCERVCFLTGCEGDSRGRGGGEVTFSIFVSGVPLKPLKYNPFYYSERTSFRTIFIILTTYSIQMYIFEPKIQGLKSIFIILVNITHPYLGPII